METNVYLDTKETAEYLKISTSKLEKLRCFGGGPVFIKIGRRVIYKIEDLTNWVNNFTKHNTSEPI